VSARVFWGKAISVEGFAATEDYIPDIDGAGKAYCDGNSPGEDPNHLEPGEPNLIRVCDQDRDQPASWQVQDGCQDLLPGMDTGTVLGEFAQFDKPGPW